MLNVEYPKRIEKTNDQNLSKICVMCKVNPVFQGMRKGLKAWENSIIDFLQASTCSSKCAKALKHERQKNIYCTSKKKIKKRLL